MANEHWVQNEFRGYKAFIGGKRFYFGKAFGIDSPSGANVKKADKAIQQFVAAWAQQKAMGQGWTTEAEAAAKKAALKVANALHGDIRLPNDMPNLLNDFAIPAKTLKAYVRSRPADQQPISVVPTAPTAPSTDEAGLYLHAAVDAYNTRQKAKAKCGQISDGRAANIYYALLRFTRYAADLPLAQWGFDDCRRFVEHFASRPIQQNGKRLAPDTAIDTIVLTRGFFSDAIDRGEWDCKSLDKCFSFRRDKLETEQEQEERGGIKTFTVAELKTLYCAAQNDRARLYFLLALNCGFTQGEIATLRLSHCHLDKTVTKEDGTVKPIPYIKRKRGKTKVWGKWRLWDETATLLRQHLHSPTPSGLALLSEDENPLVGKSATGASRYDLIKGFWMDQLEAAISKDKTVRKLGFKYLRKTGSQIVRNMAGKDISEAYLAHSDKTMGKAYNVANFKKLARALRKVRKQLQPLFGKKGVTTTKELQPA